jgi:peptidoglycan/LPS O-acetylase OafA/YrhL
MKNIELKAITILRFIAALYVFIFHLNIRIPIKLGTYTNAIISNGAVGMSVFFVLSGFVLCYNYSEGISLDYLRKRIARIYPAYLFMGIMTLPFLTIYSWKTISISIIIFISLIQAWFYQSFEVWNFGGSWSISVELFFYILFPFLIKIINDTNKIKFLIFSYIASSIIIPLSTELTNTFVFSVYYSNPIYRLPEFIFGIALCRLYFSGFRIKLYQFLLIVFILFITLTRPNQGFMENNFIVLPCIGFIMLFLAKVEFIKEGGFKIAIYLGRISYSFYLMQLPLMLALDRKIIPLFENNLLSWGALLVLNIIFAVISYHFIENNNSIRSFIVGKRRSE